MLTQEERRTYGNIKEWLGWCLFGTEKIRPSQMVVEWGSTEKIYL